MVCLRAFQCSVTNLIQLCNQLLNVCKTDLPHSIADEQTYAWRPSDVPEESVFYFDVGEIVRFRVESEEWHDRAPTGPTQSRKAKERIQQQQDRANINGRLHDGGRDAMVEQTSDAESPAPYLVIVGTTLPAIVFIQCFVLPFIGFGVLGG